MKLQLSSLNIKVESSNPYLDITDSDTEEGIEIDIIGDDSNEAVILRI